MKHPDSVAFAEIEEQNQERESVHICGNCRNPWNKYGRADCPNVMYEITDTGRDARNV